MLIVVTLPLVLIGAMSSPTMRTLPTSKPCLYRTLLLLSYLHGEAAFGGSALLHRSLPLMLAEGGAHAAPLFTVVTRPRPSCLPVYLTPRGCGGGRSGALLRTLGTKHTDAFRLLGGFVTQRRRGQAGREETKK